VIWLVVVLVVVRMTVARVVPYIKPMVFAAGSLTPLVAMAAPWTSSKDRAAAMLSAGVTRSLIMSPEIAPSTEIRLGDHACASIFRAACREVMG
jgi:hypothetical protein